MTIPFPNRGVGSGPEQGSSRGSFSGISRVEDDVGVSSGSTKRKKCTGGNVLQQDCKSLISQKRSSTNKWFKAENLPFKRYSEVGEVFLD
jgi:hypothetical protein